MHGFDLLAHLVALGFHFQAKLLQDGVEMAQHSAKLLQNCSPRPPNSQKNNENLRFFNVFQYVACLPKWLQNAPQIDPEAAKLIPKWPSWRSCWPILALLTAILAPNSSNLGSKKPQDGAWNVFFSTFFGNLLQVPRETPQKSRKWCPGRP